MDVPESKASTGTIPSDKSLVTVPIPSAKVLFVGDDWWFGCAVPYRTCTVLLS